MTPKQEKLPEQEEHPRESESNPKPGIVQSILNGVRAKTIQIGKVTQILINISIGSPNRQQRRFAQCVVFGVSITLIAAGLFRLYEEGADRQTQLLLLVGCVVPFLVCLYYVGFWKSSDILPKRDPPSNSLDVVDLESLIKPTNDPESKRYRILAKEQQLKKHYERKYERYKQYEKRRNRVLKQVVLFKCLAAVVMVSIPLATSAAVWNWWQIPTHAIAFARYYVDQGDIQSDEVENITGDLQDQLARDTPDFDIKPINRAFQRAEREEARRQAALRKATVAIWGGYNSTEEDSSAIEIKTYFEVLNEALILNLTNKFSEAVVRNLPNEFEDEYEKNEGGFILPRNSISIDNINFETKHDDRINPISKDLSYLANFTSGLAYYTAQQWKLAIERFNDALDRLRYIQEQETSLPEQILNEKIIRDFLQSITAFYLGNTYLASTNLSKFANGYDLAINSFSKAIDSISSYVPTTSSNKSNSLKEYGYDGVILANYVSQSPSQSDLNRNDDNQEIICGDRRRDSDVLIDTSPAQLEKFLARIYNNRGVAYAMKGDNEQALSDYEQAYQLDPEIGGLCIGLGTAYSVEGNYQKAIQYFSRAISVNPEDTLAYNNLGNVYASQGQYQQAITEYRKAIHLDRYFAEAYYNRGRVYAIRRKDDDLEQSARDFSEAGEIYSSQNAPSQAITNFAAIAQSTEDPKLRNKAEQRLLREYRSSGGRSGYLDGYPNEGLDGNSTVVFDNSKNDSDVFVKLFSLDTNSSRPMRVFFIRVKEQFSVERLKEGQYDVRVQELNSGALIRTGPLHLIDSHRLTITLYEVPDGNLKIQPISPSEF
jgi:tetratricopeptide (TPR) repeat protein